ncbi:putative GTP-binding protein EngB [Oceanobacillus oncorhynchi subsp. incaldanensis]|uniref:Probable GTP-binding protein EngB n=2 Tax=Oceanobacillus TaxID=182709 RepID=A0A0A1MWF5_9BACI|nr:ribosome biogenesis GTP-binding protein YihA/YsxC [Oceanobacillus oncorhynchi]MDM8100479.1 ribosome biogenesis GTP-binding protein YihA/YsxC [Oceanobacillus oncorhynchi]UUI38248.1 ribosome biogenesis GTP-binding protein YihA/YsxC [Oceanobacillus oncorhynchi]GIO17032.1 putative GTP-binding protein EngB [Oceanobacillus oncorhynchi subsp. incaldanensis]CEI83914.1 putative GTP-binding protein EngB [Oceanobacillus oncorhynchi]
MKVNQAEIVISAVSEKQYPQEQYPEFALAGRSNVGKSSLINKLINRKNLARTSSKPGKTQTLNFYLINESLYFVDVPGYGYAQVSKKERAKWGGMMEEYFKNREPLRAVILITDLRHEPTTDDVQMYDYLKFFELPVIVIGTKLDKIPKTKKDKHIKRSKKVLEIDPDDIFIPFSAETGEGKDAVWGAIKSFIAEERP